LREGKQQVALGSDEEEEMDF
jgi:hypothetical protein